MRIAISLLCLFGTPLFAAQEQISAIEMEIAQRTQFQGGCRRLTLVRPFSSYSDALAYERPLCTPKQTFG